MCLRKTKPPEFVPCQDGALGEHEFSTSAAQIGLARRWLGTFLCVRRIQRQAIDNALTASGEALANCVEHAYRGDRRRMVQMKCYCCAKHGTILIEVADKGQMVHHDKPRPERGFGFALMRALSVDVNVLSGGGTVVTLLLRAA